MTKFKIVLLQMDISFGEPQKNFQQVEQLMTQAVLKPSEIVILPELWNTGYDLERLAEIADVDGERTKSFLIEQAKRHQVFIAGGSIARKTADSYFNTSFMVDPIGQVTQYDKVHLFRLMAEEKYLTAGEQGGQTEFKSLKITPMICYDLRFPEWFRKFGETTDLFIVSAQWPIQRISQWKNLLIARAIENQCFVAAVNRVGSDPNNEFGGHSMVIDPLGNILMELDKTQQIAHIEIDLDLVQQTRGHIPVFEDRRTKLY